MTMTELHQKTGITINAISLFANNKSNGIQYNTLDKITQVLNVSVGDLLYHVDKVYELNITDDNTNDYYEMFHNKNFDVEKGIVLHTMRKEKDYYNFSYTLYLKDNLDEIYTITIDASIKYQSTDDVLTIEITNFDDSALSQQLREHLNDFMEHPSRDTSFYKVVSHLIVYQIMKNNYSNVLKFHAFITVNWRKSGKYPYHYVSKVESESLPNKNESIVFLEQYFRINLIPKDPKDFVNLLDVVNLPTKSLDFIPNIDHLSYEDLVYKIEINDDTYERTIFIC